MESHKRRLTTILFSAFTIFSTNALSPSSPIELNLATSVPDNLSEKEMVTLVCNMDAENATLDILHLMEMTIGERRGQAKCPKTLASINLLVPKCVTHKNNSSVTATGSLTPTSGRLRVDTFIGKDDADVEDFVCVAKYLDHGFKTKTVSARRKSSGTKLFSLIAKNNFALHEFDHKVDNIFANLEKKLDNVMKLITEATSCNELEKRHQATSPRQQVTWPDGTKVLCDTETDGGGWTILQRRNDGKENFYRGWAEYVNGFGSLSSDFWMGLEHMHHLMEEGPQELRIDFTYANRNYYAKYSSFEIMDASTKYKLRVGGYTGNSGNSLEYHNDMPFTTYDAEHDRHSATNCAKQFVSAWWYNACKNVDLNGLWGRTDKFYGLVWYGVSDHGSATFTEMKSRPVYRGL